MSHIKKDAKIRVLHIFDKIGMKGAPIHGGTRILLTWWHEFKDSDYEFNLCVLKPRSEGSDYLEQHGVYADYIDKNKFNPLIVLDLIKLIRNKKIKILHCHGYGAANYGRVAGFICRVPVIVHEHMIDANVPSYQKIADRVLSPLTSKGVAISKAVKDFMVGSRFLNRDDISVVYNSIPNSTFDVYRGLDRNAIAEKRSISIDKKLIGIVGRLNPIKGHKEFLESAKIVVNSFPNTNFLIIGEGELRSDLEEQVRYLEIEENVKFLGHCDDVLELIYLLDILAICSYSEGFSLAAIEGMALGKAIVSTAVGGIGEVLEHEKTALLVPAKDPGKFAHSIINLLSNDDLAKKLGQNAMATCKQKFSVDKTIAGLMDVYTKVL